MMIYFRSHNTSSRKILWDYIISFLQWFCSGIHEHICFCLCTTYIIGPTAHRDGINVSIGEWLKRVYLSFSHFRGDMGLRSEGDSRRRGVSGDRGPVIDGINSDQMLHNHRYRIVSYMSKSFKIFSCSLHATWQDFRQHTSLVEFIPDSLISRRRLVSLSFRTGPVSRTLQAAVTTRRRPGAGQPVHRPHWRHRAPPEPMDDVTSLVARGHRRQRLRVGFSEPICIYVCGELRGRAIRGISRESFLTTLHCW